MTPMEQSLVSLLGVVLGFVLVQVAIVLGRRR